MSDLREALEKYLLDPAVASDNPSYNEGVRVMQEGIRALLRSHPADDGAAAPSEEYSDLEYATRLDGTTMPAPKVLPDEYCWCGGEVGARTPGDHLGLGCLANITHNWNAASQESQQLIEAEQAAEENPLGKTDEEIDRSNRWFNVALAMGKQDDFVEMLATERRRAVAHPVEPAPVASRDQIEKAVLQSSMDPVRFGGDWVIRGKLSTVVDALLAADVFREPPTREQIESEVLDEFAGQGGLGLRVLEQGAKNIADAVLNLLGGAK